MNYTKWRNLTLNAKMQTDKKYLVLKMGSYLISTAGLGWYILYTLYGIRFAIENDFIPVVDWKNCKLPQYSASKVGKENIWEYFFEQPACVTVEQAYNSENFFVIDDVSKFDYHITINAESFTNFDNEDVVEWRKYFQKYIRLKQEIKEYFEKCRKQQILEYEEFLGVLARGTDYTTLKLTGHPKAISVDEIFEEIDRYRNEKKIFLATEDEGILRTFENRYKQKVCSVEANRYKCLEHELLKSVYKEEDGYKRDLNYLYSIYIVSKCSSCICVACGGSILVALMRKEEGQYYKYLCHGHNKAKGIIIGSYMEKEQNKIMQVGNKPLMFYALNTLKLLEVEDVDVIVTNAIRAEYEKRIDSGSEFGIKINYIISNTYDVVEYLTNKVTSIESSKVILLYTDYIVHGKDVIKEMSDIVNTLDGAYVWGVESSRLNGTENIKINKKWKIPERVVESSTEDYSLIGRYIFDFDLNEIVKEIKEKNNVFKLVDILNEYIKRKKLFFLEYKRGIICLEMNNYYSLKKADQIIKLLEEIQINKIGDFETFRKLK